jgi:NADH-quinone oxidoreductase subunit G
VIAASLRALPASVVLASNEGNLVESASIVVPIAAHAETIGSFINAAGKSQSFRRAIFPPEGVKAGWQTVLDLASALGHELGLSSLDDVRGALPSLDAAAANSANPEAQA